MVFQTREIAPSMWLCTLAKDGKLFEQLYRNPTEPTLTLVLAAIAGDARLVENGENFREFCENLGMEMTEQSYYYYLDSRYDLHIMREFGLNFEEIERAVYGV